MTDSQEDAARREAAAQWFAELQAPDVTPETWEAFLAWEMNLANAAAYREVEAAMRTLDQSSLAHPDSEIVTRTGRGRTPVMLAVAAAAAVIIVVIAVALQGPGHQRAPLTYATAIGEQKEVTLVDGSRITLNTNSRLSVSYSNSERLIQLMQGEALFEVEPSNRPFLVEAGGTSTRALGTEFDIHTRWDMVSVTLIEGKVRVTVTQPEHGTGGAGMPSDNSLRDGIVLKPGDRLDISPGVAPVRSFVDPAQAGKWRVGLLQFDNATLADAIAEMNRYSTTQLRIEDKALAGERISGTFPAGQQDAFAESLQLYLPVKARRLGDEILIAPRSD